MPFGLGPSSVSGRTVPRPRHRGCTIRSNSSSPWVRIKRGSPEKPQWLLIKHTDEFAKPGYDIVAKEQTSVATHRTMDAIATGKSRVWGAKGEE